jgi:hypothetical protein
MGGYRGGRATTDSYRQIDIRKMQRGGFLRPGCWSTWHWSLRGERVASIQVRADFGSVTLMYSHRSSWGDEEWTREEYPVSLEWTPCYFGGERAWFRCPRPGCGRRVATLWGGAMFYCRQCWNLAYESQNETDWDRAMTKAQAIRVKLGGEPGFGYDFPQKPKGMHWRTYYRLREQSEDAAARSWPPWVYRMIGS